MKVKWKKSNLLNVFFKLHSSLILCRLAWMIVQKDKVNKKEIPLNNAAETVFWALDSELELI